MTPAAPAADRGAATAKTAGQGTHGTEQRTATQ